MEGLANVSGAAFTIWGAVIFVVAISSTISGALLTRWMQRKDVEVVNLQEGAIVQHDRTEKGFNKVEVEQLKNKISASNQFIDTKQFDKQVFECSKLHTHLSVALTKLTSELPEMEKRILKEIRNGNKERH